MLHLHSPAIALIAIGGVSAAAATLPDKGIELAMQRGSQMYQFDRAAWLTSDDVMTRLPPDRAPEVGGWIVTPSPDGYHVDYFGKDAAADRVVYSADENNGKLSNAKVYPATAEPVLSGSALRMVHALRGAWGEMARHPDWQPCVQARFNTVVLPPQSDGVIPVYFLTPQVETDSFPFGGHYEVDVGSDGKINATRAFTRSCIAMTKPKPELSGGAVPKFLFLTHLLDPHPTEIHVFEQYYVGIPLVVGIVDPKSFWAVENGRITNVTNLIKP